jgi:hypothetical protein
VVDPRAAARVPRLARRHVASRGVGLGRVAASVRDARGDETEPQGREDRSAAVARQARDSHERRRWQDRPDAAPRDEPRHHRQGEHRHARDRALRIVDRREAHHDERHHDREGGRERTERAAQADPERRGDRSQRHQPRADRSDAFVPDAATLNRERPRRSVAEGVEDAAPVDLCLDLVERQCRAHRRHDELLPGPYVDRVEERRLDPFAAHDRAVSWDDRDLLQARGDGHAHDGGPRERRAPRELRLGRDAEVQVRPGVRDDGEGPLSARVAGALGARRRAAGDREARTVVREITGVVQPLPPERPAEERDGGPREPERGEPERRPVAQGEHERERAAEQEEPGEAVGERRRERERPHEQHLTSVGRAGLSHSGSLERREHGAGGQEQERRRPYERRPIEVERDDRVERAHTKEPRVGWIDDVCTTRGGSRRESDRHGGGAECTHGYPEPRAPSPALQPRRERGPQQEEQGREIERQRRDDERGFQAPHG